ncbi:zinc ribbon domain-containing protein, partial [Rhodocyclus tenuis]
MSYIYNSTDDRLDFPNPYRIENFFYFGAAGLLVIGALIALTTARGSLGSGSAVAMTPLIFGVGLLVKGLAFAARAMSRLRFFFGRGQPLSLTKELAPDQVGSADGANSIKDLLRHSSLSFPEPQGPLNGTLYSLIPNLIYAPHRIQLVAQRQFQNALAIGVSLLSLLVSMIGASSQTATWLGAFYFSLALFFLLKPLDIGAYGQASLGFKGLVALILVAILGPVLIPLLARDSMLPDWLPGIGQAGILMLVTEGAIGLFFLALIKQTRCSAPEATMAMTQGTLTMNSHPKQVQDELERRMQDQWVASLPNRRYARAVPEVNLNRQSGSFIGDLLEETQPVPRTEMKHLTLASCYSEPRYQWLGWLNTYGIAAILVAVVALIAFSVMFYTQKGLNLDVVAGATLGISMIIVGDFCFRAAGILWGRFDFVSKLIWVEMKGNYQAAQMDFGNQFTDRIKTQKQVINVESMTLRVWIAEVESVTFGKDMPRAILGMRGLKDEAEALHQHLHNFGAQQSMVIAPTSSVDVQRAQALSFMNQAGGAASGAAALPGAIAQAITSAN